MNESCPKKGEMLNETIRPFNVFLNHIFLASYHVIKPNQISLGYAGRTVEAPE